MHNFNLQLYVKAGAMREAQDLFNEMAERTLISWTILMSGYAKHGYAHETLVMFLDMLCDTSDRSVSPDPYVYSIVLRACTAEENSSLGRATHGYMLKSGCEIDDFVENALVNMYASGSLLDDAVIVFSSIKNPDLVAWSSMISAHVRNGFNEEGLHVFFDMMTKGVNPDAFAFAMATKACSNLGDEDTGKQIHGYSIKTGFMSYMFLNNSLMDFYAQCGNLEMMRQIFDRMLDSDLVSWNTLIMGYVLNLHHREAVDAFRVLMGEIHHFDDFTLAGILKAITGLRNLNHGKEVHAHTIRSGLDSDQYAMSSLLDMYIECTDSKSPNAILPKLLGFLRGESESTSYMIPSLLKWCSLRSDIRNGEILHSLVIKHNFYCDPIIVCSLIDMYSKCGQLEASMKVFYEVEDAGTAPWSTLLSGYVSNGLFKETLMLFQRMQLDGVQSNEYTFTSIILACIALSEFSKVMEVHGRVIRMGYGSNVSVVNALGRCYSEIRELKQCSGISVEGEDN